MTWQQQMPSKQARYTLMKIYFISDQYKGPDLEAQTIQKKNKREQKKKKNKSKIDISENISNKQRSNDKKFAYAEIDSIIDQQCGIKVIPIENDTSLDLGIL